MSKNVKDIDRGWKRIKKELALLDNGTVKIGVLSDAAPPEKGNMNMAKLAAIQEYGWAPSGIPSRPFMRQAFDANIDKLNSFITRTKSMVLSGKIDAQKAFNMLGVFFTGIVKETIKSGDFQKNAPSTIRAKGSSAPLIDSGRMRGSINHEVDLK